MIFIGISFVNFSQLNNGKITVRKYKNTLKGKTLSLYDLRTRECGTVDFSSDSTCILNFTYDKEEIYNARLLLNARSRTKQAKCSYTLISDTSLLLFTEDFSDTCFYRFFNESNNMVKFYTLPQGVFDEGSYAFFYGLDSIIYSQTFLRFTEGTNFTDSILQIDSIYKTIVNENEKEALNQELNQSIEAYKNSLNYSYFAGKYKISGHQVQLLNTNNTNFATLFISKKENFYSILTHSKFDINYPLIAVYTHKTYGEIKFNYNKGYVSYYSPNQSKFEQNTSPSFLFTDTVDLNYPMGESPYIYTKIDTFKAMGTEFFDFIKFKGIIGGKYNATFTSLNGKKINFPSIYLGVEKATTLKNNDFKDTLQHWKYKIHEGNFFLYNETDTFIDQMKNGLDGFNFTYHNSQPYVFGTYHRKDRETQKNEFILLFSDNTGVKFTSNKYLYKAAREMMKAERFIPQPGIKPTYFTYSCNDEYVWLEYGNNRFEELSFFNFHKAIKSKKRGEKSKNYRLID